uniref:Uncharacterized protein n=1 Tax=Mesocestoides corti TaxID=53468 RepID=A0A5K3EUQ5_MESCO
MHFRVASTRNKECGVTPNETCCLSPLSLAISTVRGGGSWRRHLRQLELLLLAYNESPLRLSRNTAASESGCRHRDMRNNCRHPASGSAMSLIRHPPQRNGPFTLTCSIGHNR